ncbi:MAG: killer suppression protein [Gammaproteobacteria bacterium]|jgi:proteic killer suppression protein|nr:killer suppression protein [Gammaproteobacteria bacterium]MBT4078529.1 killer suppression protein [Gammaproteobacteria bacterium]MBT4196861.1 killer suppression protein [Gammaproteobacteria bacterium]MBT4450004.1 killer suppression protein [Gammaproteobacteria bacterium]MBT4861887.1 killer suppression protein [Gammaproteobacteria bacterium]
MEITFSSAKLKKQLNEGKAMVKVYGPKRAKKLKIVLTSLRAAPNLGVFAPPYSPPNRCHELKGGLKGVLSVDLDHPYRLLFSSKNNPVPMREEGGLDWSRVTIIEIKGVEDTHG